MQRTQTKNHWINRIVIHKGKRHVVTGTDWAMSEDSNRSEIQLQLLPVNEQDRVILGVEFSYAFIAEIEEV